MIRGLLAGRSARETYADRPVLVGCESRWGGGTVDPDRVGQWIGDEDMVGAHNIETRLEFSRTRNAD